MCDLADFLSCFISHITGIILTIHLDVLTFLQTVMGSDAGPDILFDMTVSGQVHGSIVKQVFEKWPSMLCRFIWYIFVYQDAIELF